MNIDWPSEFDRWLDRVEERADAGDEIAITTRKWVLSELAVLQELEHEPIEETATLMRVRQSRRYPVWRVSHPFDPRVAVRVICWFPGGEAVVVVVFAGDKAHLGDVFYNSVGSRADAAIDQWKRQRQND